MKNFLLALRYFVKSGWNNVTRIVSLTLGLFVGLVVFGYVSYILSYDRFIPDHKRIYQLIETYDMNGGALDNDKLPYPMAQALLDNIAEVESATRLPVVYEYTFHIDDRVYLERLACVDTMFFEVFDFGVITGDPKEIFAATDRIMISESMAKRVFGDENPIGQTLLYQSRFPQVVSGIFRDIPQNTSLEKFDVLMGNYILKDSHTFGWDSGGAFRTYVKLAEGTDLAAVAEQMERIVAKEPTLTFLREHFRTEYEFVPIKKIFLRIATGVSERIAILSIVAVVALVVAAMNYILISISMLSKRTKTMAALKCNGARIRDIFAVSLWETVLIVALSALLALLLIYSLRDAISDVTGVGTWDIVSADRIWFSLSIVAATLLAAGLIPARIFSAVPVTYVFRQGGGSGRKTWKKALLAAESACAAFVVIFLIVNHLQFNHIKNSDYGYDTENLLVIENLIGSPSLNDTYRQRVEQLPFVSVAGYSGDLPARGYSGQPCYDNTTREVLFSCRVDDIDESFIPAIGLRIIDGRNFRDNDTPEKAIVNRRYVELRGWQDSAVGKIIVDSPDPNDTLYEIVGVVDDFWMGYRNEKEPIVFHPYSWMWRPESRYYGGQRLLVRTDATDPEYAKAVEAALCEVFTMQPLNVFWYEECVADNMTRFKQMNSVMNMVTAITLLIALSGLLGYLNEEIRRRNREMAIRKVNGASTADILRLVARDITLATIAGVAVGVAGCYFVASRQLESESQRIELLWWIFAAGALTVIALVYAVALLKCRRTAARNPIDMIRTE